MSDFFGCRFFTVRNGTYLITYFEENYTVTSPFHAEIKSLGIFTISFTVQKI